MSKEEIRNAYEDEEYDLEDDSSTDAELSTISVRELLANPIPPRDFLVEGVFPMGEVSLLCGAGGVGKSCLTVDLAHAVATGRGVANGLWKTEQQGSVLMLNAEDDPHEVARRYQAIELARRAKTRPVRRSERSPATTTRGRTRKRKRTEYPIEIVRFGSSSMCLNEASTTLESVQSIAHSTPDLKLITVDPFRSFFSGSEDDSGNISGIMNKLVRLAKETGAAVVVVHHISKAADTRDSFSPASARGSYAISNAARFQINMVSKKGEIEVRITKNNYGSTRHPRWILRQDEEGVLSFKRSSQSEADNDQIQQLVEFVTQRYRDGVITPYTGYEKDLKEQLSVGSERRLKELMKMAIAQGLLEVVKSQRTEGKPGARASDIVPAGRRSLRLADN